MIRYTIVGVLLAAAIGAAPAGEEKPASRPASTSAPKTDQQVFPTPQAAADAVVDALKNNDSAALVRMLGDRYGAQLERVDDAEERQHRRDLYNKTQEFLEIEKEADARAVLVVGRERWPIPIPLVREAAGWRFDIDAGFEEMLARRVGENELSTINVCYEYVHAQVEYAAVDRDSDEVREYAQRMVSTSGKRDGLYWEMEPKTRERPSPLESLLPDDFEDLMNSKPGVPYMGYYFKVLTRQGSNPPGGKYDYVINGNMIAGFALVAWPADYRSSGVMTFVISHQGKLFEKDLGPDTAAVVKAMDEYNPDKTWTLVTP